MNSEKDIINIINNIMPKSEKQINRLYESDSEIIPFQDGRLLINVDEFSEEDMFRDHDPYTLGWNIAVGGISDILATGGKPLYYAHSLVVNDNWDENFIKLFSKGAADVLKKAGVYFIGGDFGRSSVWRCTVTVIGELSGKPLLRSKASPGDKIYISGGIGSGNIEAFLKLYSENKVLNGLSKPIKNRFKLRMEEAVLIKKYASSCIDTSDGAFNALDAIAQMSNVGYLVENLPYIRIGTWAAKMFSLPKSLLFLGECGEYELLFTVSGDMEQDFLKEANESKLIFYNIGQISKPNKKILHDGGKIIDLSKIVVRARDFNNTKDYLNEIIACVRE